MTLKSPKHILQISSLLYMMYMVHEFPSKAIMQVMSYSGIYYHTYITVDTFLSRTTIYKGQLSFFSQMSDFITIQPLYKPHLHYKGHFHLSQWCLLYCILTLVSSSTLSGIGSMWSGMTLLEPAGESNSLVNGNAAILCVAQWSILRSRSSSEWTSTLIEIYFNYMYHILWI